MRVTPRCPGCAYDLTGLVGTGERDLDREVVCSECGRHLRVSEALSAGIDIERPLRVRGWIVVTVLLLAVFGAMVLFVRISRSL